ncbi:MAG: DNA mismatch repair endonuclease MutL [Bacillota bacterium]
MPRIILLDEATANKIAAGEVVERPASVVKELVENSFDAGAARVIIDIRGGGLDEIKVVDNGCGMDETDAVTALQRHATSKISSISDLEEICSLGFRGEALPSIAAVSKNTLVTRPPEADSGARLEVEGGRILSVSPVGCPPGTSISVRELFFNTPARLKYMKSRSTEAGQVSDIAAKLALARPGTGVKLAIDGRTAFQTPGTGDMLDALAAVYGAETARAMLAVEACENEISVRGLLAPPSVSRSSKRHITVIINGRYVRNYLVNAAVIEGFGTLLPRGRFPVAVVNIQIKPGLLDVNVHPSKMVVRVSGEEKLYNLIRRSVMSALRTDKIIPGFIPAAGSTNYNEGFSSAVTPALPLKAAEEEMTGPYLHDLGQAGESTQPYIISQTPGLYTKKGDLLDDLYPLGFLPPTYILAGSSRGLFIIDHHAAHERILYEKFLTLLSGDRIEVQILLVPAVVQLGHREYQVAEENLELLAGLGITASGFGSGSLVVREIPAGLPQSSVEDLLRDVLEYLMQPGKPVQREDLVKKLAASAACRAAVKSGTTSSLEEARAIIRELKGTDVPYTCPHGRPTMINITESELKARFKRT